MQNGTVVSLRICEKSRAPMKEVDDANFITYEGIEGDRHRKSAEQIQYSSVASVSSVPKRQVLLMDLETLKEFDLFSGQVRENVTVEGLDFSKILSLISAGIVECFKIWSSCTFSIGS